MLIIGPSGLHALGVTLLGNTGVLAFASTATDSSTAGGVVTGAHMRLFLFQFIALFALGWALGRIAKRVHAPPVVGEILAGIILGPSILGHLAPALQRTLFPHDAVQSAMLETMALFGVLLLLLETGIEIDAATAKRMKRQSLLIGGIGVILPAAVGAGLSAMWGQIYPQTLSAPQPLFYAFLGVAMSISAMVVIVRVLSDLNLVKTDLGVATLCGYTVNDVLAFVCFGVVMSLATSSSAGCARLGLVGIGALLAAFFALTWGRTAVTAVVAKFPQKEESRGILIVTCLLGAVCGGLTDLLGLTALFGFFLAGVACGGISEKAKHQFSHNLFRLVFVPVYFGWVGLQLDVVDNFSFPWVGFVLVVSLLAKYTGAWIGAFFARIPQAERHPLAIAFTPSGVIEIIISREALHVGLINETVFVAIVLSAVASTLIVGPWLQHAINKLAMQKAEQIVPPEGVLTDLVASTPEEAISQLATLAQQLGIIPDAADVRQRVLARESQATTGLGRQVALPHARLPDLKHPAILVAKTNGIDWKSLDGLPVRVVFLLLTPQTDMGSALRLQSVVARIAAHERCITELLKATTKDELRRTMLASMRLFAN